MSVHSSHGTLHIDAAGRVVQVRIDTDDPASALVLASIRRFDLDEYCLAHGRLDEEFDVLDLVYWYTGDDRPSAGYEPPDHAWRALVRPDAFDPIRLGT